MKNNKEQLNMNILDKIKKINLNGVDFYWMFSMKSLYILFERFDYNSESEIFEKLNKGNVITLLQIFYAGVLWDKEDEVSFDDFLLFLNNKDYIREIDEFLSENLKDFLYPRKEEDKKKE